jgi:endonuclease G
MARSTKSVPLWFVILILTIAAVAYWIERRGVHPDGAPPPDPGATRSDRPPGSDGPAPAPSTAADHTALGMPSAESASNPDDYLISRPQYVLSYNRSRAIPNWAAWHLSASDLGKLDRSQFAPDAALPKGWYRVTPNDYRNVGYDRGHMVPSGDRTATKADNQATFLMTNVVPQAGGNNQGPWADLENYCRDQARKGKELYIVAGGAGPFTTLPSGKLAVPAQTWKIVVALPEGDDDLARMDKAEVIAVMMPNEDGIRERDWKEFRVPVDTIARATGLTFFSAVPDPVRARLLR